jgi:cytochrome oxidase Cu insertion factor (SCO1/SenC/PrrC family)
VLGGPVTGIAPDFTLIDQFRQPVSLSEFSGRAVILSFVDSHCTTICPLTTAVMTQAKAMLGDAGADVRLVGVDANPTATSISDVRAYSRVHGILHQWEFLTGPLPRLKAVWAAYGIEALAVRGDVVHTTATYVIAPNGMAVYAYRTQLAYAGIGEQARALAQTVANVLPFHPPVHEIGLAQQVSPITPDIPVMLSRAGGGTVRLGPGQSPRLTVFFASWLSEISNLRMQLEELNRYQSASAGGRYPSLVAVDEGSVEPSTHALTTLVRELRHPLSYPVAVDANGRVADGYGVQDQPWYVLTSPTGRVLWSHDGWLAPAVLTKRVGAALAKG